MKRALLISFFFFFISLFQFGFLPAAFPFISLPNILIIITLIYTFIENPDKNGAFIGAIVAGLLNDLVSPYFGFYTIIIFSLVYILKFLLKKYVQLPSLQRV